MYNLLKSNIHELLEEVIEFDDEKGHTSLPEELTRGFTRGYLTKQSFWPGVKCLLEQIHRKDLDELIQIPYYLYYPLLEKLIQEYGPLTEKYHDRSPRRPIPEPIPEPEWH